MPIGDLQVPVIGKNVVIASLVQSHILFATFIPVELRATEPLIPLSLFKSRVFSSAALLMFMAGLVLVVACRCESGPGSCQEAR